MGVRTKESDESGGERTREIRTTHPLPADLSCSFVFDPDPGRRRVLRPRGWQQIDSGRVPRLLRGPCGFKPDTPNKDTGQRRRGRRAIGDERGIGFVICNGICNGNGIGFVIGLAAGFVIGLAAGFVIGLVIRDEHLYDASKERWASGGGAWAAAPRGSTGD